MPPLHDQVPRCADRTMHGWKYSCCEEFAFLKTDRCNERRLEQRSDARVPGQSQITGRIVLTKKLRGHSREKTGRKDREIEKELLCERWGCGRRGHGGKGRKLVRSWNQIHTPKHFLRCHVYCTQLGTPRYQIVGASRAVSASRQAEGRRAPP